MINIDEKYAYLMGWLYKTDGQLTDDNRMSPDLVVMFRHDTSITETIRQTDYSSLIGSRRIDFVRGFFDRYGSIEPLVNVTMPVSILTDEMMSIIDSVQSSNGLWTGINALEFLATLYYDGVSIYSMDNYLTFVRWADPHVWGSTNLNTFSWMKTRTDAIQPTKNRFSDAGFDLTVVSKIKEVGRVHYYDTGIAVEPANGYYFEIVGRSSISKTGWMLANNIGIIDASYRGSIIVALVRVNPLAVEIELPLRIVQMIPRRLLLVNGVEKTSLSETKRGSGGFGSSG